MQPCYAARSSFILYYKNKQHLSQTAVGFRLGENGRAVYDEFISLLDNFRGRRRHVCLCVRHLRDIETLRGHAIVKLAKEHRLTLVLHVPGAL